VGRDGGLAGRPEPRTGCHELSDSAYGRQFVELLDRHLVGARLRLQVGGETLLVGPTPAPGRADAEVSVHVHDADFFRKFVCYGNLGMGEAYMAGDFDVADDRLPELLTHLLRSRLDHAAAADLRLAVRYLGLRARNLLAGSARNVRRHYDLGDELFDCFLDSTRTYSCGYAESPDDDL
jgi:cyclopropane-fatty-acyl-phospholipid synthase